MMNELYNKRILELTATISRIGRLQDADAEAVAVSKLCGSKISVTLKLQNGVVTDFAHEVEACALGQASAAVMAREIIGASADELREVGAQMRAMLRQNADSPTDSERGGRWGALEVLSPVRDFKNRQASVLLTFDAVEDCLNQLGV
ncbi:MAG: iron-sulfur cluster assembly scaffold protein [Parvibaculales bacterium]